MNKEVVGPSIKISTVAALALTVLAGACARQDVETGRDKAARAAAASGDLPMYGGPLAGDRYSPLAQSRRRISDTPATVCVRRARSRELSERHRRPQRRALLHTVQQRLRGGWRDLPATVEAHSRRAQHVSDGGCRLAYSDGRVFRGTGDAHVVAINAADGRHCGTSPSVTPEAAGRCRFHRSPGTASCSPGPPAATTSG